MDPITDDPEYVDLPRFSNSVERVLERYPDGAPTKIVAQGLHMTEAQVDATYERIVRKLRRLMGVK